MTAAVEAFSGLEHAMELVAEIGGVRFVNDSKATNVESALRSIESFERGLVPIIGGRFKGGDLRLAARAARSARARAVVAIGEATAAGPRRRSAASCRCTTPASLDEAVRTAFALAQPGGVVLLAPACSSFDMFRDYAERGRTFKEEVARLASGAYGPHCAGCGSSRPMATTTVSSEQSSVGRRGEGLAAGNAGCPGLRSWCLRPRPTDDC